MKKQRLLYLLAGGMILLAGGLVWQGQDRGASSDRNTVEVQDQKDSTSAAGHNSKSGAANVSSDVVSSSQVRGTDSSENFSSASARKSPADILRARIAAQIGNPSTNKSSSSRSVNLKHLLRGKGVSARDRVSGLEILRRKDGLSATQRVTAEEALLDEELPEGVKRSEWHWIVDELITTLRADGANNAELSIKLAEVASDTSRDPMVRDYVIQHLGHLRDEGGNLAVIDSTLNAALSEKEDTLAGTALLALNTYGDESTLGQSAAEIAGDTSYDLRSRLTAMQVAGKQGNLEALPLAVKIAGDESQPVTLRMTAIATIGDLKAVEQEPLLQTLSNSSDTRLQKAATAALAWYSQP